MISRVTPINLAKKSYRILFNNYNHSKKKGNSTKNKQKKKKDKNKRIREQKSLLFSITYTFEKKEDNICTHTYLIKMKNFHNYILYNY